MIQQKDILETMHRRADFLMTYTQLEQIENHA
jgi:hypothetical protein